MNDLPMADAVPKGTEVEKLKKLIIRKNLVGLANNTKWNELINAIRSNQNWKPSYRAKSINGYISEWDTEWYYHLPFPFLSVEWLDLSLLNDLKNKEPTEWVINLVANIGFEFEVKNKIIRIWGYGPKSYEHFED